MRIGISLALVLALFASAFRVEAYQQNATKTDWLLMKGYSFPVWLAANKYVDGVPVVRRRELFLYIDANNFTKTNILTVVSRLRKQYSKPRALNVTIFSDEAQLNRAINEPHIYIEFTNTPEGRKRELEWYQKYYPLPSGYYRAKYVRQWWGEELEYSPNPNDHEHVIVFIKCTSRGRRLASDLSDKCWRK